MKSRAFGILMLLIALPVAVRADAGSREPLWRFITGGRIRSFPAVAWDGSVYVLSDDRFLYALTPAGEQRWRYYLEERLTDCFAIGYDGMVYVGYKTGELIAVHGYGQKVWQYDTGQTIGFSPAVRTRGAPLRDLLRSDRDEEAVLPPHAALLVALFLHGGPEAVEVPLGPLDRADQLGFVHPLGPDAHRPRDLPDLLDVHFNPLSRAPHEFILHPRGGGFPGPSSPCPAITGDGFFRRVYKENVRAGGRDALPARRRSDESPLVPSVRRIRPITMTYLPLEPHNAGDGPEGILRDRKGRTLFGAGYRVSLVAMVISAMWPMTGVAGERIPDLRLELAYRQKTDGKLSDSVHVVYLTCWNDVCSMKTLTMNQCFDLGARGDRLDGDGDAAGAHGCGCRKGPGIRRHRKSDGRTVRSRCPVRLPDLRTDADRIASIGKGQGL